MFNTVCNDCEGCTYCRGVCPSSDQNAYISKVILADNHQTTETSAVPTIKFLELYFFKIKNE